MTENGRFVVALMGARMHYAVPRLLHDRGLLERFYADICATHGWPRLLDWVPKGLLPGGLRRLAARRPAVPARLITSFNSFGLDYQRRRTRARSASELTATHLWAGSKFCELILASNPPEQTSAFVFNSAGLEILQEWRKRGRPTAIEQTIVPRRIEEAILREEEQAHPGWQEPLPQDSNVTAFIEREEAEWREAEVILCGSEFVRDGIRQCGGPVERCEVVPYGIQLSNFVAVAKPPLRNRPLRVLSVGEIGLRKGSHYVLEAARRLKGRAEFRMAGPMGLLPGRAAELQRDVEWLGIVSRDAISKHYEWADVFLLPSLCEGSATVTYEALSAGLPVITTLNSGSIVEDGLSGRLFKIRDVDGIVDTLECFLRDPNRLREMSDGAQKRSRFGSFDAYGDRLVQALGVTQ